MSCSAHQNHCTAVDFLTLRGGEIGTVIGRQVYEHAIMPRASQQPKQGVCAIPERGR